MELPVIIVQLPDAGGYSARISGPIDLAAEAPTADEAHQRLHHLLQQRLEQGMQIRSVSVPSSVSAGGWLPDDDLTKEWLQHMPDYRAECDARDRAELDQLIETAES